VNKPAATAPGLPATAALAPAARALADALPCAWLRLGSDGHILEAARPAERLVGAAPGALVGRPFDELLTLAARVVYQTHLLPLLQLAGHTAELNLALRLPGGQALDVLFYSSRRDDGSFEVLLAPIRQRRRIEDELLRVKRAADQAPMMVFQLLCNAGVPQRFPYASQSVRELYGCTPEAAAASAEAVLGALRPGSREQLLAALDEGARSGQPCRLQLQCAAGVGHGAAMHEFVATPRAMADGVVLWHGYAADVTERLRLEREAQDRSAAEQSARVRKAFLARASHELRTPLNAILGFAQLLGRDGGAGLRPDQQQALGVLQTAGRHMLSLVNRLLDLSRAETEGPAPVLQPLALRAELEAALEGLRPQAAERGVALHGPAPGRDETVLADALSLRQLLTNLLSNAVKYNRPGGRIELDWAPGSPGWLRVTVADTGVGLSDAQRAHLFEPFNRLGAEASATEGTGLGLVLARQQARSMGSDIAVDSMRGVGSRFSFELQRAEAASLPPPGQGAQAAQGPVQGTVLYVEDNEVNVLLMRALMALRPGVRLITATSGAEAEALLDAPGAAQPALLLLDLNLPDTHGHELLQRLRRRPALARVPAVLVTAAVEEAIDEPAATEALGFAERWIKPLEVEASLAALDRLLLRAPAQAAD
jgi:signal transduction histidine kinase/CheY-like chemotaxis protein